MTTKTIIESIKAQGGKITKTRKAVAKYIASCKGLFCAKDILANLDIDTVSLYRTIDLFVEMGILSPTVQLDGNQYYELHTHGEDHHHHVICKKCKKTACVDYCPTTTCQNVPGFTNVHHSVSMLGICNTCN